MAERRSPEGLKYEDGEELGGGAGGRGGGGFTQQIQTVYNDM